MFQRLRQSETLPVVVCGLLLIAFIAFIAFKPTRCAMVDVLMAPKTVQCHFTGIDVLCDDGSVFGNQLPYECQEHEKPFIDGGVEAAPRATCTLSDWRESKCNLMGKGR